MQDARPTNQAPHPSQSRHLPLAFWAMLALTAAVRLMGITRPLLGNFATKNVIYAMIARNWAQGRADLLHPTLDCLVGGQRSLHMLEFSVSAHLTGGLWSVFGGSLDVWGRATSVAFSVASVGLIFLFVRRRHGRAAAFGAGFALALSPISVIYGQSFMLDASLVFFTVATFYGLDRHLEGGRFRWLVAASVTLSLLLLTKIYMLVLLLPLGAMVLRRRPWNSQREEGARGEESAWRVERGGSFDKRHPRGQTGGRVAWALAAALVACLPAILWCVHALRTAAPGSPHAAHIYSSLEGNANTYRPPDPLLRTPDFYRQLLDDLTGVVLTPVGFVLVLAGFLDRGWREHAGWLLAMVILVAALPRKFYAMNYYYMAVLPPLCVMAGLGWQVVENRLRPGRTAVGLLLFVALVLSLRYAVKPALVTPEEDRAVVAAGRAIEQLTGEQERVVTMHGTTIDLLYYCNRPGWFFAPDTRKLGLKLEKCRRQGARYLVVAGAPENGGPAAALKRYARVLCGAGFCVYRLTASETQGQ